MSFVYRYTGSDQELTVKSDTRRYDLEQWTYWERADATEVVSELAVADGGVVEPTDVTEPEPAAEPAVEDAPETLDVEVPAEEEPVKAAPKRRTRAKKPAATEAED